MSGKKISIIIIALVIIAAVGILLYQSEKNKKSKNSQQASGQLSASNSSNEESGDSATTDANSDLANQDFEAQCESGEWIKIADVEGETVSLSGKLRAVYPEDEISDDLKSFPFFVEGSLNTALSGSDLSALDNLEDRDVEVEGVKSADGKSVTVAQVRCAGSETDKTAIENRNKFLNWLPANINSIAPEKAPYQSWTVDTADFVDDKNVYVEYYDTVENDETVNIEDNVDTSRKVLLEIAPKSDGSYNAKVLAYWEMGEDDFALKEGTDKFQNVKDLLMYQYDSEEQNWTRLY